MSEEEFKLKLVSIFENHFNVMIEVWSKCKTKRIDIVLTHKILKEVSFGIECKIPDRKRGQKIGEYVIQANHYSKLEWQDYNGYYKKIPILICPPLSYKYFLMNEKTIYINDTSNLEISNINNCNIYNKWHQDRHTENDTHHSFNGFLSAFNIGEVRKKHNKYYFVFANQILFDTSVNMKFTSIFKNNIHFNNYNKLIKRINND